MRRGLMVRPSGHVSLDNYQVVRLPWLSLTTILAKYLMSDIPFDLPTFTQCLPMVSQPLFAKKFFLFKNILLQILCCVSGGRKRSEHKYLWLSYVLWINSGGWNEWENPLDWPGQCLMKWGEYHRTVMVSRAKCALSSHGKISATGTYHLLVPSNRDLSSCLVIFYLLIIQQPSSPYYYQASLPTLNIQISDVD